MQNLVVASDFDLLPYNIPNLDKMPNAFAPYVAEKQEELLKSLLGKTLYDSFDAGLNEDYPAEMWVNLRDGDDYLFNYKTYEWVGMKAMLKPYIYSEWLRDTFDSHSGIGVVVGKGDNAKVINPGNRIARGWNAFSDIVGDSCHQKNTLHGYLSVSGYAGTFDGFFDDSFEKFSRYFDFVFKSPGYKNTFNL